MDVADRGYAHGGQRTRARPRLHTMGRVAATDSIAELRAAVRQAARALRDGEPTGPEPTLRPSAEAGAGRLQLQRGDAAGGAARRSPA